MILAGAFVPESAVAQQAPATQSPGNYPVASGFVTEVVMTFMFLIVILGATDKRVPAGFAPIAIGLGLTLIHLISIPVTQHVGEPRAKHRPRPSRRRVGSGPTVDVLGCTAHRRGTGRCDLSMVGKRERLQDLTVSGAADFQEAPVRSNR